MFVLVASALGCMPAPGDESGVGGEHFATVATGVPGGALLSGWSDGNTLLAVGGQIGGGAGLLAHISGDTLCVESPFAEKVPWWIHGEGANWVAVGESGLAVRSVAGERTRIDVDTDSTLFGAWLEGDEIIAVGGRLTAEGSEGEVWRHRDGNWEPLATGLSGAVYKVWNGWMVGDGVAFHYDGETLSPVHAGGEHLLTVRGREENDIYAVGGMGSPAMLHYDGEVWSEIDASALGQPLNGVWTAPGDEVFVAGNFGVVAALLDGEWAQPEVPLTADHLHAAVRHQDQVYFLGGNLFDSGEKQGTVLAYGPEPRALKLAACAESSTARNARPPAIGLLSTMFLLIPRAAAAPPTLSAVPIVASGETISLGGQPAVVNLWASWCVPCLAELPRLDALSTRLVGVARVVAVSIDTAWGPAAGVVSRLRLNLPVGHDPGATLPRSLAAPGLPATYVLDAGGNVVSRRFSELSEAEIFAIEAEVRAMAAR